MPEAANGITVGQLIDDLTYSNYAFNRERSPHISPERWARIYPRADELEARYQSDKAITQARAA